MWSISTSLNIGLTSFENDTGMPFLLFDRVPRKQHLQTDMAPKKLSRMAHPDSGAHARLETLANEKELVSSFYHYQRRASSPSWPSWPSCRSWGHQPACPERRG